MTIRGRADLYSTGHYSCGPADHARLQDHGVRPGGHPAAGVADGGPVSALAAPACRRRLEAQSAMETGWELLFTPDVSVDKTPLSVSMHVVATGLARLCAAHIAADTLARLQRTAAPVAATPRCWQAHTLLWAHAACRANHSNDHGAACAACAQQWDCVVLARGQSSPPGSAVSAATMQSMARYRWQSWQRSSAVATGCSRHRHDAQRSFTTGVSCALGAARCAVRVTSNVQRWRCCAASAPT